MTNKTPSAKGAIAELIRSGGAGNIPPEVIHGYKTGAPVNFNLYDEIGFHHPKRKAYYDGLYNLKRADSAIVNIYEGIKTKGTIDDPLIVYVVGAGSDAKLIVLDGATRLSCISFIRNEDPSAFKTVPVILFKGSRDEARVEMVRRNREGNSRPLDCDELAEAIRRFQKWGWTDEEIRERLSIPERSKQLISKYLNLYDNGIPELKQVLRAGMVSLHAAFTIARLPSKKQMAQVKKIQQGKKITVKEAESANNDRVVKKVTQRFNNIDNARQDIEMYCSKNGLMSDRMMGAIECFAKASQALNKAIMEANPD